MPMSNASMKGQTPGPAQQAGGQGEVPPPNAAEISQAAADAVDAAITQRQQEARKVAM
jgi:hypothetical protein